MLGSLTLALALGVTGAAPPAASQPTSQVVPKSIAGAWEGPIKAGGRTVRIVVRISKKPDGTLAGELDSPDQGATGLGLQEVGFADGKLRFALKIASASYEGTANGDLSEITGQWKQRGVSFPLNFKRMTKPLAAARRPQMPKRPFPYREEDVTYENKKANVKFAATLTVPRGKGPFPAALLITGSGPQDRDESIMGHKPFLVLADYLTRHGIAVLRADDRGVGGSTGSTPNSTTADFADDALAGMAFLKTRREIDSRAIGLIGHSEGGIIGPLAASRSADVAFVVMLAGTGLKGEDVLYAQGEAIILAEGGDAKKASAERALQEQLFLIVRSEKDSPQAEKRLRQVIAGLKAKLTGDDRKELEQAEAGIVGQLKMVQTPWFQFFLDYDPRPALRKTHCPVLALNGEKDRQVPAKQNLAAIADALTIAGNPDFAVRELPGLNHLFQHCKTGGVSEYTQIEETLSPQVLALIADWVRARTGRPVGPWI